MSHNSPMTNEECIKTYGCTLEEYGKKVSSKNYNHVSHSHCYDQQSPPCGIKGHHCCLCEIVTSGEQVKCSIHPEIIFNFKKGDFCKFCYKNVHPTPCPVGQGGWSNAAPCPDCTCPKEEKCSSCLAGFNKEDIAGRCTCGENTTKGIIHRKDNPCYIDSEYNRSEIELSSPTWEESDVRAWQPVIEEMRSHTSGGSAIAKAIDYFLQCYRIPPKAWLTHLKAVREEGFNAGKDFAKEMAYNGWIPDARAAAFEEVKEMIEKICDSHAIFQGQRSESKIALLRSLQELKGK